MDLAGRVKGRGAAGTGRHRRGSVQEVQEAHQAQKQGGGGKQTGSSGRHRRGSVKEISVEQIDGTNHKRSRHRRGSVKEVAVHGREEEGTSTSKTVGSSGRHRRGSVQEVQEAHQAQKQGGWR